MSIQNPLFLLNDSDPASLCKSEHQPSVCAVKGPTGVWMLVFRVKSVKSASARAKQIESLWQYCEGVTTDKWNRNAFVRVFLRLLRVHWCIILFIYSQNFMLNFCNSGLLTEKQVAVNQNLKVRSVRMNYLCLQSKTFIESTLKWQTQTPQWSFIQLNN